MEEEKKKKLMNDSVQCHIKMLFILKYVQYYAGVMR
jgi:hypothetical protein